ncbi:MAG: aspartate 1-decarboxylase [Capsulimonadaceae bacterium]|nr:aspartate 1-decarboxylase [Capsulimonadaceae bacterium]
MLRQLLKSKIHRCTITEANVDYIGSITIDQDLLDAVDIWPGELVHVWNIANGERLETYALPGERGSGVVCLNGAAALRVEVGHKVIVAAFAVSEKPIVPKVILIDDDNKIARRL